MFDLCIVHECALCMSFRRCDASTYDVEEIWEAVALHYFGLTIVCLMGGKDIDGCTDGSNVGAISVLERTSFSWHGWWHEQHLQRIASLLIWEQQQLFDSINVALMLVCIKHWRIGGWGWWYAIISPSQVTIFLYLYIWGSSRMNLKPRT